MKKLIAIILLLGVSSFSLHSCREDSLQERIGKLGSRYFSVKQYAYQQWKNYEGNPFTIIKFVKTDTKTDTLYTNSEKFDWNEIFNVFFETDISGDDLQGHYKFSQSEDRETNSIDFFFESLEDYNFTQKLLISADPISNHIKCIYIETFRHSIFGETQQKLFYVPFQKVLIQKYDKPLWREKKSTITQYNFSH